jgi:sugar phosphate isomerase/epimerase
VSALGLAHLTALDLPPGDLIPVAARSGFRSVGLRVHPATAGGPAYPTRVGTSEHRALAKLLRSEGMRLNDIEFIQITPDIDIRAFQPMLEAGGDLGAASVTVSGDDPDEHRLAANFAGLCDLARPFGLRVDLEFMRWRVVGTLQHAAAVVQRADKDNGAVLVDALHLSRSGGRPADLAGLPPRSLRAVQLCDAGAVMPVTDAEAISEAREGRLPPGDGSLPLGALMDALPADVAISVEMPSREPNAERRIATAFAATQRLMSRGVKAAKSPTRPACRERT